MDTFRNIKIKSNRIDIQMKNKNELNVMIMNTRTIRDYLKRILVMDLLRNKEVDIAFVNETFLLKTDKLYLEGYKIFRDDNCIQRRKGVAIIINRNLNINIQRIAADPNGRFVKVRIQNRETSETLTCSCVYLEPNGDINDINKIIFASDVIVPKRIG